MNCTYTFWSHPVTSALIAAAGAILATLFDVRGHVQRFLKARSKPPTPPNRLTAVRSVLTAPRSSPP